MELNIHQEGIKTFHKKINLTYNQSLCLWVNPPLLCLELKFTDYQNIMAPQFRELDMKSVNNGMSNLA
jgi:hypothetical protein